MRDWIYSLARRMLTGDLPDPRTRDGILYYGAIGLMIGLAIGLVIS